MRTALVLSVLLLAPAFAGCADRLRDRLEPAPSQATVLPWGLSGCSFVVAFVPVPASRVAPHLPAGFQSLSFAQMGFPNDPRGEANVGVEAWRCQEGVGHNESAVLNAVPYGTIFTAVEPPADLKDNESTLHFLKWDVLVPDAPRRGILQAAGVPAMEGNVTFNRFVQAPTGGITFDVVLDLNGTFAFRGTSAVAEQSLTRFAFTEFTPVPEGYARWRTNVTADAAFVGGGFLGTPPGLFRDVAGGERVQAYYIAGVNGAFSNGTIVLPPRPLP